jgi:Tfp pilus assembly protein PilX
MRPQAGCRAPCPPVRQQGIVLIIALIVMVALSLAGVALVRSVETTTAVVGNLSFRQAALLPANLAVEQATSALFADEATSVTPAIHDKNIDVLAENYFAARLKSDDARGIPFKLQKKDVQKVLYIDAKSADVPAECGLGAVCYEVRYVIERSCNEPGPATAGNCDMMSPKQNSGTTVGDSAPPTLPQIPFYRVTVRVDGPQNTTAFLQAMLR